MDSFLRMVAADLRQRMQGDLSHTVVVFPNQRAKLYFDEYLAEEAQTPLWAPTYMSISELLCSMSSLKLGEPIKLICHLYDVYHHECGGEETLDDFYFWGEMLLNDFNDVDKSMVSAKNLFRNIQALHEMDDLSYLSKDQLEALRHFFSHFDSETASSSKLKERFSHVWNHLLAIYDTYRQSLSREGIAYEGMLYRQAVEQLDPLHLPFEKYVFVGFNILTRVEHQLFSTLKHSGQALFYWDYDTFYVDRPNHEASTYLSQNIREFPSPLPREMFSAFSSPKKFEFVEASTETAQARFLHEWTKENLTLPERDTAIVLCNEALLSPVLHSLPTSVEKVNVTMGFPLVHTPVFSLVAALIETHTRGYNSKKGTYRLIRIQHLLRHPFLSRISPAVETVYSSLTKTNRIYPQPTEFSADEVLAHLFTPTTDKTALCTLLQWTLERVADTFRTLSPEEQTDPLMPIHREALFTAITVVNRFRLLIDGGELAEVKTSTFCSLLQQHLSMERIPFHSEPAEGLQIMGVIETRNLDFRHVVLLSCNEGFMPRVANDVSFIPYNLRKAFDMPTIEHKISLYAYYFYRLLQRADTVSLVYNSVNDGRQKGEMSRFMLQLLVDTPQDVQRITLTTQQQSHFSPLMVEKTPEVLDALHRRFNADEQRVLSPSALNAFMDCPLKFYLKYAANLSTQDEADEEVDNAMFGTLFHKVAEDIYNDLKRKDPLITATRLHSLLSDSESFMTYVDNAFRTEFFQTDTARPMDYNGLQLINREAIAKYARTLLEMDAELAPFEFVAAEKMATHLFHFTTPSSPVQLLIGGVVDRMDRLQDGTLRIVDYKTGGSPKLFKEMTDLIAPNKERANYVFQIFLYSTIIRLQDTSEVIRPQIVYVNRAKSRDYHPFVQRGTDSNSEDILNFTPDMEREFQATLSEVVRRIFDPNEPFTPTAMEDKCKYCDFTALCGKVIENK